MSQMLETVATRVAHTSSVPSGRRLWCISVAPLAGAPVPCRGVALADGQGRIVAALQHVLVCLADEPDGVSVIWEYATGGPIVGSPAAAPDGSLRFHSSDGRLHGVSPLGERLWPPLDVGAPLNWASPLVDAAGTTWVCAYGGGLLKVDADGRVEVDGKKAPRLYFRSPHKFDCAAVLHGTLFVVGGEDQFVHAIDTSSARGTDAWNSDNRGRTHWCVNLGVAVATGPTFVVASLDGQLYGFAADGTERWNTPVPGQALGPPVVDGDDRVLLGLIRQECGANQHGALACFDIRRQQWLWEAAAPGPVECTPVVGNDGTVYFGDNSGCIQAVSASSGKLQWKENVGQPIRSAGTIVAPGHVVFADDAGRLFALQCDSPALGDGWPALLGPARWQAPALPLNSTQPVHTRFLAGFAGVSEPLETSELAEAPSQPSAARPGRFASIVDFLSNTDVLKTAPWELSRRNVAEERPLCLANDGPGDLVVSSRCFGRGVRLSPAKKVRIRSGRRQFVVLTIEPDADEWLLVDFQTSGPCKGRRARLRIHRTSSP